MSAAAAAARRRRTALAEKLGKQIIAVGNDERIALTAFVIDVLALH